MGPRSLGRTAPLLALACVFVAASAVFAVFALQVHSFQPDEALYVQQSRSLADDFPSALFDSGLFQFGAARLNAMLGALATALFDTPDALRAHKVLNAAAFASVVVPAYLLGRLAGLLRWSAVLAAALSVAVPWATLSTSLLSEPVAYPAFCWGLFGCCFAALHPGPRGDLAGLGLVALAALARSNFAVLGAALVVTVLAVDVRTLRGTHGGMRLVREIARRRAVLLAAASLAVVALAVRGTALIGGAYTVEFLPDAGMAVDMAIDRLAMLAQGLVVLPFAVGLAWTLRHVLRPLDAQRHAVAVATLSAAALLIYSLSVGIAEERYAVHLAPPLLIATVVAFTRRDVPVWLVGAGGVAGAVLALSYPLYTAKEGYAAFLWAGQAWWGRVITGRASVVLPEQLAQHADVVVAIAVTVVAVVALALAARAPRPGRLAIGAVLAGLLVNGLAAAAWALPTYLAQAGLPDSPGYSARLWIDPALPDGLRTMVVEAPLAGAKDVALDSAVFNEQGDLATIPTDALTNAMDVDTGTVDLSRLPRRAFIALPDFFQPVGLPGATAEAGHLPVRQRLYLLEDGARAEWLIEGPDPRDGWLPDGTRAVIRSYGGRCITFDLVAPPEAGVRVILDGPARRQWRLDPGQAVPAATPGPGMWALRASGGGFVLPDGRKVTVRFGPVSSVPCAARRDSR